MIKKEVDDIDKYWSDMIYSVCDGNASEINALKRFDIFDFFVYVDNKMKK